MANLITVDRWSYDGLRRFAEHYLAQVHPDGTIPVPIEEIVDLQLQVDVVPMELLRDSKRHRRNRLTLKSDG